MNRMSARHGVLAGLGLVAAFDPVLVRNVVVLVGAAALVVSLGWLVATGRSL